jgi:hypothetical protein
MDKKVYTAKPIDMHCYFQEAATTVLCRIKLILCNKRKPTNIKVVEGNPANTQDPETQIPPMDRHP